MTRVEPQPGLGGEARHVAAYLDFFRATVIEKARSLPEAELRRSSLPSGWTPLELLQHLAYMERRWFTWGFLGAEVPEPWGDSRGSPSGRWFVPHGRSIEDVVGLLEEQALRTTDVLESASLDDVAATTGRFAGSDPPDLRWICFHVLHEYARHTGHLDVAVEMAGGHTGE